MHGHGYGRRHGHGRGRLHFHRPFPNRQELLARLEAYQRDLEQEVADVADLVKHLRDDEAPAQAATQEV
jgi:hypothetical protein